MKLETINFYSNDEEPLVARSLIIGALSGRVNSDEATLSSALLVSLSHRYQET